MCGGGRCSVTLSLTNTVKGELPPRLRDAVFVDTWSREWVAIGPKGGLVRQERTRPRCQTGAGWETGGQRFPGRGGNRTGTAWADWEVPRIKPPRSTLQGAGSCAPKWEHVCFSTKHARVRGPEGERERRLCRRKWMVYPGEMISKPHLSLGIDSQACLCW